MPEKLLKPAEAAEIMGVTLSTIYRMIHRHELKVFPGKGHMRLYAAQFEMPKDHEDERVKRIWG